jgi:hypothetical protein
MKICPQCKNSVIDGAKFCMECGFNIKQYEAEQSAACPSCGAAHSGGKFCPECGARYVDAGNHTYHHAVSEMENVKITITEQSVRVLQHTARESTLPKAQIAQEEEKAKISALFEIEGSLLVKYKGKDEKAVIPSSVTCIGNSAFKNCTALTSIVIPSSVTSIGESAFEGCTGITAIDIPSSVTSIGNAAFKNCTGLTSIAIPSSVKKVGAYAFEDCTGLTLDSITIADGVDVGCGAFWGCDV